uniref:Uncharacterized protein n=1 Tax=Glossina brevipalpis TaxID=37001 RepID=A0A1A9W1N0_9MUSC
MYSITLQKTWTMEIVGVEGNTTNSDLVTADWKVEHINRTSTGISGTIDMRYEFTEDSMIEIVLYRSATGNADSYQLLPYRILKTQVHDFMDQYYKGFIKDFETCSNFPVIETKARDYKFQQLYRFNKCTFTTDPMPNYLQEGYYKAIIQFSGETDWSVTCIAHVESIRFRDSLDTNPIEKVSPGLRYLSFSILVTKARDYKFLQLYRFEKCTMTNDPMPNYMPEGYYKVIIQFSGETDWSLTFVVQVESTRQ